MDKRAPLKENLDALRRLVQQLLDRAPEALRPLAQEAQARLALISAPLTVSEEQRRLAALYKVSRALGSSLDLEVVLSETLDAAIELTGAERGFLMLTDPASGSLETRAARLAGGEDLDRDDPQISHSVIEEALQSGETVLATNALEDKRFANKESVTRYALRSVLCSPLRTHGHVIGAVYVDNRVKSAIFNDADGDLLEALAAQAAAAIENARLYQQVDSALARRVAELETLQAIDRDLNEGLDARLMLTRALNWALRGTNAERGWIASLNEDSSQGELLAADGADGEAVRASLSNTALLEGLREGAGCIAASEGDHQRLFAPARREGRPVALIAVEREGRPFSGESSLFLARLAERVAVAFENTRLYQAAQAADQAKTQFISMVAHELKVPMTAIRGYTDLILGESAGTVTEDQVHFLNTVQANVERMQQLVNDLMDIAHLEAGRMEVVLEPLPLQTCAHEALAALLPQIEAKGQALAIDLPKDLPPVQADHDRLVQVLSNLISNAHKYSPEGGHIRITAHAEGDHARLAVQDDGIGLSEEDRGRLFSEFFRAEEPLVREQSGWGLGLYVTKRLMALMGGEIGVQSRPGEGSTFSITLPFAGRDSSGRAP